jgi:MoxR-like ATPase
MTIAELSGISNRIIAEVEQAVVGKQFMLKQILAAMISMGGHILMEDNPGLAKTLVANAFATALGMDYKRVQFTPDLLPGDITGGYVFNNGSGTFSLRKGPIFTHILLADEINRASPKTQSALLEAMQEYQVTIEGESLALEKPFIVIATQNPVEYEGTFPLPEAQLDRFIVKLSLGYPTPEEEQEILRRRRERKQDQINLNTVVSPEVFLQIQQTVEEVYLHPDIERYIVDLVVKTRHQRQVLVGVSPRGSLALMKLSRAWAAIHGRNFVLPDDVKIFAKAALGHRMVLEPSLWGSRSSEQNIIDSVVESVPVPVIDPENEA